MLQPDSHGHSNILLILPFPLETTLELHTGIPNIAPDPYLYTDNKAPNKQHTVDVLHCTHIDRPVT